MKGWHSGKNANISAKKISLPQGQGYTEGKYYNDSHHSVILGALRGSCLTSQNAKRMGVEVGSQANMQNAEYCVLFCNQKSAKRWHPVPHTPITTWKCRFYAFKSPEAPNLCNNSNDEVVMTSAKC